jgi:hypothetical protein
VYLVAVAGSSMRPCSEQLKEGNQLTTFKENTRRSRTQQHH